MKVIILDGHGRLLLIKRSSRSKGNPGKWDFPGGKVDPGEKFDDGLLREVLEETRLRISLERPLTVIGSESPSNRIIYLFMEGKHIEGDVTLSEEHDDFVWVHPNELEKIDLASQFKDIGQRINALLNKG